jgi:hypothetical protein
MSPSSSSQRHATHLLREQVSELVAALLQSPPVHTVHHPDDPVGLEGRDGKYEITINQQTQLYCNDFYNVGHTPARNSCANKLELSFVFGKKRKK